MILHFGEYRIRTIHNENNRFWKPIGFYRNTSEIMIDKTWWRCNINFIKKDNSEKFIQITHPMKVEQNSSLITKVYTQGVYAEFESLRFKVSLLKFLLNQHDINYSFYKYKSRIFERKNTLLVFFLAISISLTYYYINVFYDNNLMKYVSENIWIQTVFIFLTISGFISIFYPFTIQKGINEMDVKKISEKAIKEERRKRKANKRARKNATL